MRRLVVLFLIVFLLIFALLIGIMWKFSPKKEILAGEVIGLIRVSGILAQQKGSFGGVTSSDDIVSLLEDAGKSPRYKGVILRINSPGGTIAAAQEVYAAIKRFRLNHKPIVASMGDVAASGGYYIASACDEIVANPGTITGSIGTILEIYSFEGLFEKLGIEAFTFKEGKFKDIGNWSRRVSREEEVLLQNMASRAYQQFFQAVLEGRKGKITEEQLKEIADGRPILGEEALEYHLVDSLGTLEDAINRVAALAGIKGKPEVKELKPAFRWWELLSAESEGWGKLMYLHFYPKIYWMEK
ncbi:MAG: signal peptide peptidase SppA [bacterium JZ-2024 1]